MVGHFDFLSLDVQPRISEGKEIIAIYFRGGGRGTLRSGEEGKNTIKNLRIFETINHENKLYHKHR